jgi:DNA-binding PadR family transcriptional regulator
MTRSRTGGAQSFLPLTPGRFHVLVALASGDKHGYGILKEVARQSDGSVRFSTSTLYSVLDRLHEDGLIEESGERPDPALDDERRRYYRLTELGVRVVRAEAGRLEPMLAAARAAKLTRGSR